jgi:hypothetical protein
MVSGFCIGRQASIHPMQYQVREGDWGHHSFPEPVRVIGIGPTVAVRFGMERCERLGRRIGKVSIAKVQQAGALAHERSQNSGWRWDREFTALATSVGLICLIVLVLALIAGVRP